MINLLPEKEKEVLRLDQIKNLTIILGSIILVSLVCLILILMAIKFYLLQDVEYQKFLFQQAQKKYQSAETATIKGTIQKYNDALPQVLSFYKKEIYFSDVLNIISEIQKSQGLNFTKISLDGQNDSRKINIIIAGISADRDSLVDFQKKLQGEQKFKNVSFSPDSWINPTNSNFNVTFEYDN
jgi:hypothetical protein